MTKVFIAGSMKIKRLDQKVMERIDKVIDSDFGIVIGDAEGADASIQAYLRERGAQNVVVYCSGVEPRNNLGHWPVRSVESESTPGSRLFFTAKDLEMAKVADYGLMVWDARSTGTLSNIVELLSRGKISVVFVNKEHEFRTIKGISDFEALVTGMSPDARRKADDKIRLSEKIRALKQAQLQLFA